MAHVVVSKYADHLPLYRQAQIYARQGVKLDRFTLADWTGRAAWMLRPLHQRLLERLKASEKLFADETTAPVLDPGRGRTKTGQLWVYARDDPPWNGPEPPGVAYVYAPDRKAERPIAHLAGFRGVLQVDGYAGYRALADQGQVRLAFCWSHVRRRFYELAAAGPAPVASEALTRIAGPPQQPHRRPAALRIRGLRTALTKKMVAAFDPWLDRASASLVGSFARGLARDHLAVRAAIATAWSNAQAEGQINKLKLVKRQMYGRGKLDLLQARLVGLDA